MLFQCLCGFKLVFYSTHSDDEPELIKLLPEGYQQACYETKAIERKRTV